jgi:hypothetical protein
MITRISPFDLDLVTSFQVVIGGFFALVSLPLHKQ